MTTPHPSAKESATDLTMTLIGVVVLWLVLDRTAAALGSLRGEWGVVVCIATLAAALAIESTASRRRPSQALAALGFNAPNTRPLLWSLALCAALLSFYPLFALATGATLSLRSDWPILLIGIFAQAGLAEETVFRGFLFRRLRETRSFWKAAAVAALPFIAIHALLFLTLDATVAAAALVVSVSLSFPLAWLFECSGGSIIPPALVHAVVQGAIKLVEASDADFLPLAMTWMALSTLAPWLLFLLRPRRRQGDVVSSE